MTMTDKILIILETSVIRNPKSCHGSVSFGINYNGLKDFVAQNGLADNVDIAITRMTFMELIVGRSEEYAEAFGMLNQQSNLLSGVPGIKVNIDQATFAYNDYFEEGLLKFMMDEEIIMINYPPNSVFEKMIERGVKKEEPFHKGGNHSDYGFKDVVIWESILAYEEIDNYKKVIFFTNDNGFGEKCIKEFSEKHNCYFLMLKDPTAIIKEIKSSVVVSHTIEKGMSYEIAKPDAEVELLEAQEDVELNELIESEYFKDGVKDFVIENLEGNTGKRDDISINTKYEIENWIVDDEVVGRKVVADITIGEKDKISIMVFVNDMNGIENYEII